MAKQSPAGRKPVVKTVGVAELKAKLSKHLRAVQRGERFVVTDHGVPVAQLSAVAPPARRHELTITRPTKSWSDFVLPEPLDEPVDPLPYLLEERRERF